MKKDRWFFGSKDDKIAHEVKRMEWKKSQKKIFTVFLCMFIAVLCAGCLKKEETVAEQDTEVQKKNTEQIQEKTEEKKPEETFVPIIPEEPFSYLSRLKNAFLVKQAGKIGIILPK